MQGRERRVRGLQVDCVLFGCDECTLPGAAYRNANNSRTSASE